MCSSWVSGLNFFKVLERSLVRSASHCRKDHQGTGSRSPRSLLGLAVC